MGSEHGSADLFVVDGACDWGNSLRLPDVSEPTHKVRVEVRSIDDVLLSWAFSRWTSSSWISRAPSLRRCKARRDFCAGLHVRPSLRRFRIFVLEPGAIHRGPSWNSSQIWITAGSRWLRTVPCCRCRMTLDSFDENHGRAAVRACARVSQPGGSQTHVFSSLSAAAILRPGSRRGNSDVHGPRAAGIRHIREFTMKAVE